MTVKQMHARNNVTHQAHNHAPRNLVTDLSVNVNPLLHELTFSSVLVRLPKIGFYRLPTRIDAAS